MSGLKTTNANLLSCVKRSGSSAVIGIGNAMHPTSTGVQSWSSGSVSHVPVMHTNVCLNDFGVDDGLDCAYPLHYSYPNSVSSSPYF